MEGLFTCPLSPLAAPIQRKQTAGDLGLRVRFSPVSAKDQGRKENSSCGKEQH